MADIRRRTRHKYHYAIRYTSQNKQAIIANKMSEQVLNGNSSSFWANVTKVKGAKTNIPTTVDTSVGNKDICELFAEKYETLYNLVPYNDTEMGELLIQVDNSIKNKFRSAGDMVFDKITVDTITKGISALKKYKTDIDTGHSTNHLIHGDHMLNVLLSFLFNSMLNHGVVPNGMMSGTIIPIPKNKLKSLNDSNNYRGITLSSILGKLFDNIILQNILNTSDLQFGFKNECSTTYCTFVLEEVIQYYKNNKTDVYVMMLDASKAFDRVGYVKLLSLLLERGLCPVICRLLIYMYTNQSLCVKWDTEISKKFSVQNGVKQGGILSPIMFTVYMDVLLLYLKKANLGCHIGDLFMGALGYADDVVIIAPTVCSLKSMLLICDDFGKEFHVKFNSNQFLHYPCTTNTIVDNCQI